ncbi:ReoY family proteolytic degradation factor [Alkalicoccobacillus porphyridii]|uniref:UPF0302 protein FN960_07855 n=1 Tax=Alkalicoccobacillus porphyridii TaxID=2597270 RepID=A0A553ZZV7_9BACI|nr:ReoY family proteolytic degradation factor [Alkalicoccobacillus porphyridii]TSB46926.1 IDEAL domain-containing protein [Alkalicoccobacillus porphyridii]
MGNTVPVVDKKDFLKSFLKQYELKRRECAWLLNYLMSDDHLMEKVHFIEQAEQTPKALVISAQGMSTVPFSFRKHQHVTTDAEKAFHDIRLNQSEEIYIELHFKGAKSYSLYLAVLEENPYLPENQKRAEIMENEADRLLSHSLYVFRRNQLLGKIDDSLDARDHELFKQYSEELRLLDDQYQTT